MFRRKPKPAEPPVAMVVGLGNPGPEYAGTRHNVGFEVVDLLAADAKAKLDQFKFQARYGVARIEDRSVALVKPLTFMNLSGRAVAALARHYGLTPDQIIVVGDDLDLEVGRVRLKPFGGAGGHNGHRSVIASLGTDKYPRIKIGIGKAEDGVDHVLSRFKPDERTAIDAAVRKAADGCRVWLSSGVDLAMNRVNG